MSSGEREGEHAITGVWDARFIPDLLDSGNGFSPFHRYVQ